MTEHELVKTVVENLKNKWTCFPECKDGQSYGRRFLRMDLVAIRKTWKGRC